MTFWPIREGPGAEAELDAFVHEVVRKHPHGVHLNDVTREVRQTYPANGVLLYATGVVEREWVQSSLCRLAIRGYIYRIGTDRYPIYELLGGPGSAARYAHLDMRFNPLAMDEDINIPIRSGSWPRWKPVSILEVLAKAAAGDEPYATKPVPPKPPRFVRFLRAVFGKRSDSSPV